MQEPRRKTVSTTTNRGETPSWSYQYELYTEAGQVIIGDKCGDVGKGFVPRGGLILRNVCHQGYKMADDIGITGIYITRKKDVSIPNDSPPETKYLVLGPPDFIQYQDFHKLELQEIYNPLVEKTSKFGIDLLETSMSVFNHNLETELKACYKSSEEMFGDGTGFLYIEQKFIFTGYDGEPAHEPLGALKAARFHPIVHLYYDGRGKDVVESFRVDYRFNFKLDHYLIKDSVAGFQGGLSDYVRRVKSPEPVINAAGIFSDENSPRFNEAFISKQQYGFNAAEKPLVAEIITKGLSPNPDQPVWDNLHWWGAGPNWAPGSTPGSYHAVHIHWRWGNFLQEKALESLRILSPFTARRQGDRQFRGWGNNGSLTDYDFADQTMKFAIVLNEKEHIESSTSRFIYNYTEFEKNKNFGDLFKTKRTVPKPISDGADIVLYYSAEMETSKSVKYLSHGVLQGSFFLHGIFFAHDDEPDNEAVDQTDVKIRPNSPDPTIWDRYPYRERD